MSPADLIALGCPADLADEICRSAGEPGTVKAVGAGWADLWRLIALLSKLGPEIVPLVQRLVAAIQAKDLAAILLVIGEIVQLIQGAPPPPEPVPGA